MSRAGGRPVHGRAWARDYLRAVAARNERPRRRRHRTRDRAPAAHGTPPASATSSRSRSALNMVSVLPLPDRRRPSMTPLSQITRRFSASFPGSLPLITLAGVKIRRHIRCCCVGGDGRSHGRADWGSGDGVR